MVLRGLGREAERSSLLASLGTRSVWTIDLAMLLHRHGVRCVRQGAPRCRRAPLLRGGGGSIVVRAVVVAAVLHVVRAPFASLWNEHTITASPFGPTKVVPGSGGGSESVGKRSSAVWGENTTGRQRWWAEDAPYLLCTRYQIYVDSRCTLFTVLVAPKITSSQPSGRGTNVVFRRSTYCCVLWHSAVACYVVL